MISIKFGKTRWIRARQEFFRRGHSSRWARTEPSSGRRHRQMTASLSGPSQGFRETPLVGLNEAARPGH